MGSDPQITNAYAPATARDSVPKGLNSTAPASRGPVPGKAAGPATGSDYMAAGDLRPPVISYRLVFAAFLLTVPIFLAPEFSWLWILILLACTAIDLGMAVSARDIRYQCSAAAIAEVGSPTQLRWSIQHLGPAPFPQVRVSGRSDRGKEFSGLVGACESASP